jgi:hypothetical protein
MLLHKALVIERDAFVRRTLQMPLPAATKKDKTEEAPVATTFMASIMDHFKS